MDIAKSRHSIKNRRVSFNDKASIRVFERDESDNELRKKSNDAVEKKPLSARLGDQKSPRKICSVSSADKENIFDQVEINRTNEVNGSAFYTTLDFIEKTQLNSVLQIENTADITLLSDELNPKRQPLFPANKPSVLDPTDSEPTLCRTFHVQETEMHPTQCRNNITKSDNTFRENMTTSVEEPMMTCESMRKLPCLNQTVIMEETLNNIYSPIIHDVELSSPLVPIEYVSNTNRKLNLRQLNDDLEHGKIQIYPGMVKTPQTAKRKCVQNLFDGSAMSFCSPRGEKSSVMTHNEPPLRTNAKRDIRFSEADDILLNNTSYLTKAVLEDETITGNVLKVNVENKTSNDIQKSHLPSTNTFKRSPVEVDGDQLPNKTHDNFMDTEMDYDNTFHKRNKEFEMEVPPASVSNGKMKPRNTMHFHEAIDVENLEKNIELKMKNTVEFNPSLSSDTLKHRNTLHFDEAIGVESPEEHIELEKEMHAASIPMTCSGIKKPRNTMHLNEAIGVESPNETEELKMEIQTASNPSTCPGILKRRNTLHFDEAIAVESTCEDNELKSQLLTASNPSTCPGILKRRNSQHFDKAIGIESSNGNNELKMEMTTSTKPLTFSGKPTPRNTIHFNEAIGVECPDDNKELNCSVTQKVRSVLHFDEAIDEDPINENTTNKLDPKLNHNLYSTKTNFQTRIDDASFVKEMSVSMDGEISLCDKQRNTVRAPDTSSSTRKRVTMHLNEPIRDDFAAHLPTNDLMEKKRISNMESASPLKVDGPVRPELETQLPKSRNGQRNTLFFSSDDDIYSSPTVSALPHRSLIEFEQLESEVRIAQQRSEQKKHKSFRRTDDITLNLSGVTPLDPKNNSVMFSSPIVREDTHKRLTVNLTPNMPMAKKRQTLIFNETISNCSIMETDTLAPANVQNIQLFNKIKDVHCQTLTTSNNEDIQLESSNKIISENVARENPNNSFRSNIESVDLTMVSSNKPPISTDSIMQISKLNDTEPEQNEIISTMKLPEAMCIDSIMEITKLNIHVDREPKEIDVGSPSRNLSKIPILISSAKKKMFTALKCHDDPEQIDKTYAILENKEKALPYTDVIVDFQFKDSLSGAMSIVEDNPITISDVSNHFLAVRHSQSNPGKPTSIDEPTNKTDIDMKREFSPLLSCEQNTIHNLTNFKNKYINLTYDKNMLDSDDIDKTCLSLVGTLLDDDEVSEDEQNKRKESSPKCHNSNDLIPLKSANSFNVKNKSLCLKCKRCQDTINNDTTIGVDTFALCKEASPPDVGLSKLRRLRSRPTLADIELNIDSVSFNKTFDSTNSSEISYFDVENKNDGVEVEDNAENIILNYKNYLKEFKLDLMESQKRTTLGNRQSFVKRLEILFRALPGWIFDYQMQYKQILVFQFKRIKTLAICISYDEDDEMGYTIKIKNIQCCRSSFPEKNWKPMDFLLDFQLKLDLPIELKPWCSNNTPEGVFDMFERIDQMCKDVYVMGLQMWKIVCSEKASLLREGKRVIIRKMLRKIVRNADDRYNTIEKREFQIEVLNLRNICYKDIIYPSLHLFHEELQLLPQGLGFLQMFLKSPDQHFKGIHCS